jgi:hypothetical protein
VLVASATVRDAKGVPLPDDKAPDADGVTAGEPLTQTVAVGEGRQLGDSTGRKVVTDEGEDAPDCELEKEVKEVSERLLNPLLVLEVPE